MTMSIPFMTHTHYILDDNYNIVKASIEEWAIFFGTKNRFLRKDSKDNIWISTVFLGLDHNFGDPGPPILFESMSFQGDRELDCFRYATYKEAIEGHNELCRKYDIFYIGTTEPVITNIKDLE